MISSAFSAEDFGTDCLCFPFGLLLFWGADEFVVDDSPGSVEGVGAPDRLYLDSLSVESDSDGLPSFSSEWKGVVGASNHSSFIVPK